MGLSGVHRQLVLGVSRRALVFIFLLALTEILAFAYSGRADTLRAIAGSAGGRIPRVADRLLRALIILELSGQEIFVHPAVPARQIEFRVGRPPPRLSPKRNKGLPQFSRYIAVENQLQTVRFTRTLLVVLA